MSAAQSAARVIGLVAKREFSTRVFAKSFLISTAVVLAVIIGGQVAIAMTSGGADRSTVGVVAGTPALSAALQQSAKAFDTRVEVRTVDTEEHARRLIAAGDLDVMLVGTGQGRYAATTEKTIGKTLRGVVDAATQQLAVDAVLADHGMDRAALDEAINAATVRFEATNPDDPDKDERTALAYVAVLLLFFTVYLYGLYVAMGVVEEKSSRVVELLLSTIEPLHLLLGKVVGIGAVGLLQVAVFGTTAVVVGTATGVISIGMTAVALLLAVLIWYVVGFAFFALLYAAMGSLVSRQEDVNAATMPLNILAFGTFFAAQASLADPTTSWSTVLSWIPPFSATLMPMRIAAGVASPLQSIVTVVIMVAATGCVAVVAARIYRHSVLNTGAKQSWRKALAASR